MNNVKLKQIIIDVLKADERLWNEDKTELNQTLLLDLVENIDEKLIELLLQEKELRDKFFVKIKDVYVFKTNDFRFFIEENKVDNSYTQYKNRIGLTDGKRFLKDTNDVVLNWPYKDCVLEGGQSSEEGLDTYFEYDDKTQHYKEKQAKRKEIFFNSVLAHDEIDRLFDHKAMTNWKRFTKDGEQEVGEIKRDEDGTIRENLIIKGNNLLALHSLKKQFAGKVKLIYIDPPYNTGNDGFKYNDNFNHSTWLTFMKNRLEVARELLRDDGVIFVSCDDNEQAYLKVLMDEVFRRENFVGDLIRKTKSVTNDAKVGFNIQHENTLIFSREKIFLKLKGTEKDLSNYSNPDNDPNGDWVSSDPSARTGNTKFEIKNPYTGQIDLPPNGRCWAFSKESFERFVRSGKIVFKKEITDNERGFIYKRYKKELKDLFNLLNSLDGVNNKYMNQVATKEKNKLTNSEFEYPKPEDFLKLIIQSSTQPNDIVLDYHLGSGTTAAVAHKMGRQYIGVEQMDYIETIACERLRKVIHGEQGGISKSVNWQGGGDFIYFELAEWNETAKEKILECESLEKLEKFFDEMYERYFLNYNLKIKEFKEKVLKEDNFRKLSLDEQKKIFVAMLDNNQMYVNKTEMADNKFGISEEDQNLTNQFYNSEK
jgi:adenine-specific DNA-methyltransferase